MYQKEIGYPAFRHRGGIRYSEVVARSASVADPLIRSVWIVLACAIAPAAMWIATLLAAFHGVGWRGTAGGSLGRRP